MKKIKRLEGDKFLDDHEYDLWAIVDKINEIIDHINTHEEEHNVEVCPVNRVMRRDCSCPQCKCLRSLILQKECERVSGIIESTKECSQCKNPMLKGIHTCTPKPKRWKPKFVVEEKEDYSGYQVIFDDLFFEREQAEQMQSKIQKLLGG